MMIGSARRAFIITTALLAAGPAFAQDVETTISGLPDMLTAQYEAAPQTVLASAWGDWTPPVQPYEWCHSESYQGNPRRVAVTNELERLVQGLIDQGIVSDFELADSNGDASQQINQIRGFIDKGCGIITSIPGSATRWTTPSPARVMRASPLSPPRVP